MLDEVEGDLENKPKEARYRTTGVNSAQVLKDRGTAKSEPQRRPLRICVHVNFPNHVRTSAHLSEKCIDNEIENSSK